MKAIIIDDEQKARNLLRVLLEENCPQITTIESADSLLTGVELIRSLQPDIVFLDIEMSGHSGIQILDFFEKEEITFEIIFTTAYSEYALKAFELNAIDYLLKPLRDEQVANAVKKAINQIGRSRVSERLDELRNTLKATTIRKIGLPVSNGILFVEFDAIVMLEADRMYTKVHTNKPEVILVSKPLKFFLDILLGVAEFYRPHRSYLINLKHVKQYVNQDGGYVVMDNQQTVPLSKERKDELFSLLQAQ
jgi:two-component system LytT family response regulator